MQTIYRMWSPRTTAELRRRRLRSCVAALRRVAIAVGAAVILCPSPGASQTTAAVGMVEQSCPPPLPPASEAPTDAEATAAREALAERQRADWGGLCRYRAANEALLGASVEAVFIGDSITEFWGPAAPDLFQGGVVNRGVSAQTSPQMLLRFYADVITLRPRVVHILAGTNDIAGNTGPNRPEDFKNNIRAMVDLAQAHDVAVIVGAIPPSAAFYWRPELRPASRIAELNAWLREFARERGALFVDYHAAMRGPRGELRPELTTDGVHPDARGYVVMTRLARDALGAAAASPIVSQQSTRPVAPR